MRCAGPVVGAAVTVNREPWMKVSEYGVVWSGAVDRHVAPVGALANESARLRVQLDGPRVGQPAAVGDGDGEQQVRGVLVVGAWKLPDETPGKV